MTAATFTAHAVPPRAVLPSGDGLDAAGVALWVLAAVAALALLGLAVAGYVGA